MMNVGAVKVGKIKAQRSNGVTGLEDLLGNLGLEPELDKV